MPLEFSTGHIQDIGALCSYSFKAFTSTHQSLGTLPAIK